MRKRIVLQLVDLVASSPTARVAGDQMLRGIVIDYGKAQITYRKRSGETPIARKLFLFCPEGNI